MAVRAAKADLRKRVLAAMRAVSADERTAQSSALADVVAAAVAAESGLRGLAGGAANARVGVFLSQPVEIDLDPTIGALWRSGAAVFVPHVFAAGDARIASLGRMVFVELLGPADADANVVETGRFKLRQVTTEALDAAVPFADAPANARRVVSAQAAGGAEGLHVIAVPGVAFDARTGARMGRGAGYYDEYLAVAQASAIDCGVRPPQLMGVCYSGQVLGVEGSGEWLLPPPGSDAASPCVPVEAHDVALGAVATASGVHVCDTA